MQFIGSILGSFNGKLFFKIDDLVFSVTYVTPKYNDYNEWIIDEITLHDQHFSIFNETQFELNLTHIDSVKLKENILHSVTDNEFFLNMHYVKYRAPTLEEINRINGTLDNFQIGEFIYTDYENEMIKFNEFTAKDEIEKLTLLILKEHLANSSLILNSTSAIYF